MCACANESERTKTEVFQKKKKGEKIIRLKHGIGTYAKKVSDYRGGYMVVKKYHYHVVEDKSVSSDLLTFAGETFAGRATVQKIIFSDKNEEIFLASLEGTEGCLFLLKHWYWLGDGSVRPVNPPGTVMDVYVNIRDEKGMADVSVEKSTGNVHPKEKWMDLVGLVLSEAAA